MKTKMMGVLLLLSVVTWSCTNAQNSQTNNNATTTEANAPDEADGRIVAGENIEAPDDCEHEGEDCTCGEGDDFVLVKFSGAQPSILDFARAYLSIEDMGEGYGSLREALERYDKGQKPEYGELIVDTKNGYINYTVDWSKVDAESTEISTNEMCYWNCKDGRHKIFASNLKGMTDGKYYETEVTGLNFLGYDSQTKSMEWYSQDQLGALILPEEMCWPVQDPENSKLGDDYFKYAPVFSLPRTGKNIEVDIHDTSIPASKHRTCTLVWNGEGFTKKFNN